MIRGHRPSGKGSTCDRGHSSRRPKRAPRLTPFTDTASFAKSFELTLLELRVLDQTGPGINRCRCLPELSNLAHNQSEDILVIPASAQCAHFGSR